MSEGKSKVSPFLQCMSVHMCKRKRERERERKRERKREREKYADREVGLSVS